VPDVDPDAKGLKARAMHKILFGTDDKTKYSSDVEFVHKFIAYFPLKVPGAEDS